VPLDFLPILSHLYDLLIHLLQLLQGSEDRVVPKPQADAIYESITSRGGVVEYKVYPGEGHGFRMEATRADSLDRERLFYEKMLKIVA
jgi:dipeptidyl aminopeptidase/acylaminoacyl peptidase